MFLPTGTPANHQEGFGDRYAAAVRRGEALVRLFEAAIQINETIVRRPPAEIARAFGV